MGAAVSWMDKMWVMLCCANSSLSRASADRKENREISHIPLHPITIHNMKVPTQIKTFLPNNNPPPLKSSKQMWPYGLKVLLLFWTERKTGKPMFLKQYSLGQKQETVIVLIKFCSLKGSQMFSASDRCVFSSFFLMLCKLAGCWCYLYKTKMSLYWTLLPATSIKLTLNFTLYELQKYILFIYEYFILIKAICRGNTIWFLS